LIILGLGALGVLLTLWRLLYLGVVFFSIRRQHNNLVDPKDNNPLGRVILQGQERRLDVTDANDSAAAMQYKLDEAVLVEVPALERGHNFIKLLAAISPLLGLLGTVTGMILTFQAISLFGSGDPKLMASGISQALVTTVLGLVVAIPLLFGHSLVSSLSRTMIQRLDEQSAGIMAEHLGGGKNINP
ncbi:MAG: MotA/TolQ/ExbB proton channel family protein, partial [Pseudomonadota bacterium]